MALLVLPLWLALFTAFGKRREDWRDAFLAACTIWGVVVAALTEGLSLFNALSLQPLAAAWFVISLVSAVLLWRSPRGVLSIASLRSRAKSLGTPHWIFLGGIGVILVSTACVALICAPNNFDSMTYHLTRVLNWMDHHSVRHYPAHDLRELYSAPWAEFAILHLQLLSGGDRFAACVQYMSMLGSLVAVSRIASKLGASGQGQLFASVCCATIPMGILQASSTQNDLVTAFWLVCFLNTALDLADGRITWGNSMLAGASLGLAALTKPTGLLFAAPFLAWVALSIHRRRGVSWTAVPVSILCWVALINAPHIYRNWSTFHSFLEPSDEDTYSNSVHSPAAITSNVVRNLAVHANGLPFGRKRVATAVRLFHRFMGWNVSDPRTTFDGTRFGMGLPLFDDTAGNPAHLALGVAAILICLRLPRHRTYALCVSAGFVLFCALLKWQPWISRLQLPLFVAVAPIVGIAFDLPGLSRARLAVGTVLLLAALFPATMNGTRPLISRSSILFRSRESQYFADLPSAYETGVEAAVAELSKIPSGRVGIIASQDHARDMEYPLRRLVLDAGSEIQFEDIEVHNSSARSLSAQAPVAWPDTVVTIYRSGLEDLLTHRGLRPVLIDGPVSVYRSAYGAPLAGR
jgi:hypothetical protein